MTIARACRPPTREACRRLTIAPVLLLTFLLAACSQLDESVTPRTTVAFTESPPSGSPVATPYPETTTSPAPVVTSRPPTGSTTAGTSAETRTPASSTASPSTSTFPSTTVPESPDIDVQDDDPPSLDGRFISVIVSAVSEKAAEEALADLEERFGPQFGVLLSDEFPSLNPGYWVVYAGPFTTAAEAQDTCWSELGMRSGSLCYGRRLSQDPADREVVFPPREADEEPEPAVATTARHPSGLAANDVYQLVAPSVAHIVNGGSTGAGSGILIEGGYVVTNYHVVEPYRSAWRIVFADGTEFFDVPVVGWAPVADLALLGPIDTLTAALELVDGEGMFPGTELFLVGYPAEPDLYLPQPSVTQGILSRSYEEPETGLTVFRTDAAAVGGQSGGAMVNSRGEVVGVTMRGITPRFSDQVIFTEAYSAVDYAAIIDRLIATAGPEAPTGTGRSAVRTTEPGDPASFEGMFIAVLRSETSQADAERARDNLEGRHGRRFGILLSTYFRSLNPGYWVVYAGPFPTAVEAQEACSRLNMRTASLCYGRRLSQDPSDREIVYPPVPS